MIHFDEDEEETVQRVGGASRQISKPLQYIALTAPRGVSADIARGAVFSLDLDDTDDDWIGDMLECGVLELVAHMLDTTRSSIVE